MEKRIYTDEGFIERIRELKENQRFSIKLNDELIGIECIRALGEELIIIGLYGNLEEKEVFIKPVIGGELNYGEDAEGVILEYIHELFQYFGEEANKEDSFIIYDE